MKTILFPTDFSENAQNAYTYALHLAEKLNASITTLHTYLPIHVPANVMANTVGELSEMQQMEEWGSYEEAAKRMHEKAVTEHLEKVEVNHILKEATAVDAILQTAIDEKADLVVMGTKGASGLLGSLIGSNTARVIEEASIPVLAIPHNAVYRPIQKMAIAMDFDNLQENAIVKAIEYAERFNAELHCIHVNVAHNPLILERMSKLCSHFADTPKLSFEVLDVEDVKGSVEDVLETIDKYVHEKNMDMLVMQTHKRTFFQKLFSVSYTKKMAFHTNVPLLTFK
ncbi:MAG: universal stress protein [Chitinophagales bacterium]